MADLRSLSDERGAYAGCLRPARESLLSPFLQKVSVGQGGSKAGAGVVY